jgi:S-adenosylmethionine hydrolase
VVEARQAPIITLTTDFGTDDVFVGVMKGVILGINPSVQIVDLTHGIPPQAVNVGALCLRLALPYFPPHTIHVAVVDPGVGSARRPLCVETPRGILVGPDNGLLAPAAALAGAARVVECTERAFWLPAVGSTFHGRDIFAPVAAHLSAGISLDRIGRPGGTLVPLALPQARLEAEAAATSDPVTGGRAARRLRGEVIHADRYGNLITNVTAADLEGFPASDVSVSISGIVLRGLVSTYSAVPEHTLLALVDSWGLLEIAERNGSARERVGAGPGAPVLITTWRTPEANPTAPTATTR